MAAWEVRAITGRARIPALGVIWPQSSPRCPPAARTPPAGAPSGSRPPTPGPCLGFPSPRVLRVQTALAGGQGPAPAPGVPMAGRGTSPHATGTKGRPSPPLYAPPTAFPSHLGACLQASPGTPEASSHATAPAGGPPHRNRGPSSAPSLGTLPRVRLSPHPPSFPSLPGSAPSAPHRSRGTGRAGGQRPVGQGLCASTSRCPVPRDTAAAWLGRAPCTCFRVRSTCGAVAGVGTLGRGPCRGL